MAAEDVEITKEADGSFTIDLGVHHVEPIRGIPTLELADHIRKQLWAMHRAGNPSL